MGGRGGGGYFSCWKSICSRIYFCWCASLFKDVIFFFLTAYLSIVWVRAPATPYLGWSPKYDVQERQVMIYSILMWASVHNTTCDSHYTSLALSRSNNSERQENYLVSVRGSGGGLSKEDGPNPKMYSVGPQDIYSQLICRLTVPVQYGHCCALQIKVL